MKDMERLGQIDENQVNRSRPLKTTIEKQNMRNIILKNSKNLKNQPKESPFKKVFLNQHPAIGNEEKSF